MVECDSSWRTTLFVDPKESCFEIFLNRLYAMVDCMREMSPSVVIQQCCRQYVAISCSKKVTALWFRHLQSRLVCRIFPSRHVGCGMSSRGVNYSIEANRDSIPTWSCSESRGLEFFKIPVVDSETPHQFLLITQIDNTKPPISFEASELRSRFGHRKSHPLPKCGGRIHIVCRRLPSVVRTLGLS